LFQPFSVFYPARAMLSVRFPANSAPADGSGWHADWTDHGDVTTGAWQLIGLASTLLALILVN
jgi:hypothetical protein